MPTFHELRDALELVESLLPDGCELVVEKGGAAALFVGGWDASFILSTGRPDRERVDDILRSVRFLREVEVGGV